MKRNAARMARVRVLGMRFWNMQIFLAAFLEGATY
jgi:hypothetical protein